jgi:hypothetical protein
MHSFSVRVMNLYLPWLIPVPARTSSLHDQTKFTLPPPINEKEVYATFLSTRVGSNSAEGEAEHDWYYNATRVLIHRLLRKQSTRGSRHVVVLSQTWENLTAGVGYGERPRVETRSSCSGWSHCETRSNSPSSKHTLPGSHVPSLSRLFRRLIADGWTNLQNSSYGP